MTVLRRLDLALEPSKEKVFKNIRTKSVNFFAFSSEPSAYNA
jgi:hypothetical protein